MQHLQKTKLLLQITRLPLYNPRALNVGKLKAAGKNLYVIHSTKQYKNYKTSNSIKQLRKKLTHQSKENFEN